MGSPSTLVAHRFTPREVEILRLVAQGLTTKAIADQLGVSSRTVETHLERLFKREAVRSRSEAVATWLRNV